MLLGINLNISLYGTHMRTEMHRNSVMHTALGPTVPTGRTDEDEELSDSEQNNINNDLEGDTYERDN